MFLRRPYLVLLLFSLWTVTINHELLEYPANITRTNDRLLKDGLCPRSLRESSAECAHAQDRCGQDSDCEDEQKCCDTGCGDPRCVYPEYTGCQQVRIILSRRRQLDGSTVVPECDRETGKFKDIQCNEFTGKCWCVDDLGFELPGTRESNVNLVNCSNPRPCADVLCRMLCPYSFELDSEGCPICRCRNPCLSYECPAGQECQLEDVPCLDEICPPLATCKQPRKLEDLCPIGVPLSAPDSGKPFLCGVESNKPQCPPNFLCDVVPGNDYGVCCPLVDKPGACPKELHADEICNTCNGDMDCGGVSKCCFIDGCGQTCTKPANTTLCLQQKAVVELLLSGSSGYDGYVPQCLENGEFSPKQCSNNGNLCWCVTVNGTIIAGTMAPKTLVECFEKKEDPPIPPPVEGRTAGENEYIFECEKWDCSLECEAGFKYDGKGCRICECSEPCKDITCPDGMDCMLVKMDNCLDDSCFPIATCRDASVHCTWGRALRSNITGAVTICRENECPATHFCEIKEDSGICCPRKIVIEHTKDSDCPDYIYEPEECGLTCGSDEHCSGELKCCPSKQCGAICVPPKLPKMPTMCEYIRDSSSNQESLERNATLAIAIPQCLPSGPYNPKQCDDNGECFCVDEFGVEIFKTRTFSKDLDCVKVRDEMTCLGLICRLGCDFGFMMDENGCPLCSCRNPCQNVACDVGKTCEFLEVDCKDDWCPPLPYCVPIESSARSFPECPSGNPLMYEFGNEPVLCDPFSSYPDCPSSHECIVNSPREMGICCPQNAIQISEYLPKQGQCPYLIPAQSDSCQYLCSSDADCEQNLKCCSNGCGTRCVNPILKTACQHQRYVAEHRAAEMNIPVLDMFMPSCTEDGKFAGVQFHPTENIAWCVDKAGREIPGTRQDKKEEITCAPVSQNCTVLNCDLACLDGYKIDSNGCQICQCNDPCEDVTCKNSNDQCRLVNINCVSAPCPPIPLCLPKPENPCPVGEPLTNFVYGNTVQCGPQGEQCPSSHRCYLSPLEEYAVCCPNLVASTCEQLKKRNLQLRKTTNRVTFLPKCNRKTGAWDPTQCMESLGLCWCVDSDGNQIPGSLVRGVPHCTARAGKSLVDTPICRDGVPAHICPEDLCQGKICLAHPNATCNIDPCGGCRVQFLNDFNEVVDCNHGLTACFAEVQDIINSAVLKGKDYLDDDLLPALEEIVEEMILPPPVYPPPPPPPQFSRMKRRQAIYDFGSNEALFDYDSSPYENSNLPALQTTASSIVVPNVQRMYINVPSVYSALESQISSLLETMAMQPMYETSKPDVEIVGLTQRFTIIDDGQLSYMVKPGSCPAPSFLSILHSISQGCKDQCVTDFDCPVSFKCCLHSCGLSCVPPTATAVAQSRSDSSECPRRNDNMNPFLCMFSRKLCSSDTDCAVDQKCCESNCGPQCTKITRRRNLDIKPAVLKAAAPKCSTEGGYAIAQKQGELSWCVDKFGLPIHKTLTRGTVECDSNGTILSRFQTGPVCADENVTPMVCKDECIKASCSLHPEAICIADTCNNCAVKFVDFDGSPVACEGKCRQKLEVGNCRSSLPRFFFNTRSRKCQQFFFGGCGGNENNFETLAACQDECEKKVPACEQSKQVGMCLARIPRWFYNKNTHQCEKFYYGGCSGNDNNFETLHECESTCPDQVLCPWLNVNGENLNPCSRSDVCANITCPGNSRAICIVDPCTCKPSFIDKKGSPVTCSDDLDLQASLKTADLSKYTRCQSLAKNHRLSGDFGYIPQCDENGDFLPAQCSQEEEESSCWCVDEAGMQLPNSQKFKSGTKTCNFVRIKKVEVTLAFSHEDMSYSEVMKPAIKRLIEQFLVDIGAESPAVSITVIPYTTKVMFTLLGENKVQVAFQLSEMMRMENILIVLPRVEMVVDPKASHFYYENENIDDSVEANLIKDAFISGTEYNWALFALFIAVGCIVLFLVFYVLPAIIRRKLSGKDSVFDENGKPSLISMVFHNVTYGLSGRKSTKKSQTEAPKVVVQTVEAEYESMKKEIEAESNEAPPAYDDVKDKSKDVEKN